MPLVIPVFIPHEGCPHACVFCNQHRITGRTGLLPVSPGEVKAIITEWLQQRSRRSKEDVQVAFFGGSFTGLPEARQTELLEAVTPFLAAGQVQVIRISTRPDYLTPDIISRLRHADVRIVELGVQSLDPLVLEESKRGHGREEAIRAIGLLRAAGMQAGVQLMVGLPGETALGLRRTTRIIAALRPDFVRIYPVLVLRGSELARRYVHGQYLPLSQEKAVVRTAWMYNYFTARGIRVVRMGLQPGPDLTEALLAGPFHPAFGHLVLSRIMLQRIRKIMRSVPSGTRVRLSIAGRDLSIYQGIRSANVNRLRQLGLMDRIELVIDPEQPRGTINILEPIRNPV